MCEVRGSLVVVAISKAFSFTNSIVSYVLSLVVYNVDPNLSLAAPIVSEVIVDSSISNVLIVLTFSLATPAISEAFPFVDSSISNVLIDLTFSLQLLQFQKPSLL